MPTLTIIHCLFWKAKKAKQRRVKRAPKQAHEQLQERQLPQNQDPSAAGRGMDCYTGTDLPQATLCFLVYDGFANCTAGHPPLGSHTCRVHLSNILTLVFCCICEVSFLMVDQIQDPLFPYRHAVPAWCEGRGGRTQAGS